MLLDFQPIAVAKFRPALGVMSEPLAQLGTWRDLLHPFIDCGVRLLHSSRPQAVDKDPRPILGGRRFVGSLQSHALGGDLSAHGSLPLALFPWPAMRWRRDPLLLNRDYVS